MHELATINNPLMVIDLMILKIKSAILANQEFKENSLKRNCFNNVLKCCLFNLIYSS